MPRRGIFLNYRQNRYVPGGSMRRLPHAQVVEAVAYALRRHFGTDALFVDTTLRIGSHYPSELRDKLRGSEVLVAVIHEGWRADLEDRIARGGPDWVRDEIAKAFEAGIKVVPVLLDEAALPAKDELPEDIAKLALQQAHRIRFGQWDRDLWRLVQALEDHVAPDEPPERVDPHVSKPRPWQELITVFVGGASVPVGLVALLSDPADRWAWFTAVAAVFVVPLMVSTVVMLTMMYLLRERLDTIDQAAVMVASDLKANVIIGLTISGLGVVALLGGKLFTVELTLLMFGVLVGFVIFFGIQWLLRQRSTRQWPTPLLHAHPLSIRAALHRTSLHIAEHQPLLNRLQRDQALFSLDQIEHSAAVLADLHALSRWEWLRKPGLWCWGIPVLLGLGTSSTVAGLVEYLRVGGTWWAAPFLAMGALALFVAWAFGVIGIAYRCQRWRKAIVLDAVPGAVAELRARVAQSSIPPVWSAQVNVAGSHCATVPSEATR